MGRLVQLHGNPHEQTQKLLPWYVNGTLGEGEVAMVDAHLAECAECAAELAGEQGLRKGVASLGPDVDHGWAAMRRRLDTSSVRPVAATPLWRRRIGLGWAMAGQAVAAVLVGGAVFALSPARPDNVYHALGSAPEAATPGNAIVLFAPDMPSRRMRELLAVAGARVIDGPLASGGYMLRLPEAERSAGLARLRAAQGVVMAEPVDAEPAK